MAIGTTDWRDIDVVLPGVVVPVAVSARRAVVSWSGGKDCTLALSRARKDPHLNPVTLLTTYGEETGRVGHHGVPVRLIEQQATALDLSLETVPLPPACQNAVYESRMAEVVDGLAARGIEVCVFGDIALDDVRAYRENRLAGSGVDPMFPLWGVDTRTLAEEFVTTYRATVVAIDRSTLGREAVGRPYDRSFLADLPPGTDPAGERGEFHTFVHDGPLFETAVEATRGRTVERSFEGETYAYVDLAASTDGRD